MRCKTSVPLALVACACVACAAQDPPSRTAPQASGERYYQAMCSNCHGPDAAGTGSLTALLKIPTPDLVGLAARNGGSFPREAVRSAIDGTDDVRGHGNRSMPVWGGLLDFSDGASPDGGETARRQIDAIVQYLESIQRAQ